MDNEKRKRKEALRKVARLEAGMAGKKQGEKINLGYEIKDKEGNVRKVGSNYKSPEGVKVKDMKGATPIMSKYGAPKGKLGGGVGRIPMYDKTKNKLESVESESTLFTPSKTNPKETIAVKGYDVKSKTSEGLSGKVNEALTETKIGKDISSEDKAFSEAPEFTRNRAKQLAKPKYTKGSRTVMQVIENADVKTDNASSGLKEGSRKLYRKLKKYQNKK